MSEALFVNASITIPASDLSWTAVRSSGPGGQNVNKVSSKVELRFELERCTVLDEHTRGRLRVLAASRLDAEGRILIVSQATRDRQRNVEDARAKLASLVREASARPKRRRPTRPSASADRRRLDEKKRQSARKRDRQTRGD